MYFSVCLSASARQMYLPPEICAWKSIPEDRARWRQQSHSDPPSLSASPLPILVQSCVIDWQEWGRFAEHGILKLINFFPFFSYLTAINTWRPTSRVLIISATK